MSEKPLGAESCRDPQLWADDLAAVIDQLGLDKPVLDTDLVAEAAG
jgi:non-heme chloroperoxidase